MKCKKCGHALSNNSVLCPFCGTLMTEEQLKRRKELNGYNNRYIERLNKLNEDKIKYKLEENEEPKNIGSSFIIVLIIIIVTIIGVIIYMSR